jgi:hypothetical protein
VFHLAALLFLWLQAAPPPSNQNVVRVCSVAEGAADPCQDFDARSLEPSGSSISSGQRAFIDPETGMLTEPTQEQTEALSAEVAIHESVEKSGQPPTVITLPDGTLHIRLGKSFAVSQSAVVTPRKEEKKP